MYKKKHPQQQDAFPDMHSTLPGCHAPWDTEVLQMLDMPQAAMAGISHLPKEKSCVEKSQLIT